jgi:hypothetical protein
VKSQSAATFSPWRRFCVIGPTVEDPYGISSMFRRLFVFFAFALALAATSVPPAAAQDAADAIVRLNRLESQFRQISGQMEQLQYENRQLKEQLRKFQEDVEFRFQEGRGGGSKPAPAPSTATPSRPAPQPTPTPAQPQRRALPARPVPSARPRRLRRLLRPMLAVRCRFRAGSLPGSAS